MQRRCRSWCCSSTARGIGKSSLPDVFAEAAQLTETRVVPLDARDLLPSSEGVRNAVEEALLGSVGALEDAPSGRTVLLLDSYERLAALDDGIRQRCCLIFSPAP